MFLCVLDFEATCIDSPRVLSLQEIIEISNVLLYYEEERNLTVISEFQQYVCPKFHQI